MFAIINRLNELNPPPAPVELNIAEKLMLSVCKAKSKVKGDALKEKKRQEVADARKLALLEADKMVLQMSSIMEEIYLKTKMDKEDPELEILYNKHSELNMEVERIRAFG